MTDPNYRKALIVGAGAGLSAALARAFAKDGLSIALAARNPDKLRGLAEETGAQVFACDASRRADVEDGLAVLRHADASFDSRRWTDWATRVLGRHDLGPESLPGDFEICNRWFIFQDKVEMLHHELFQSRR